MDGNISFFVLPNATGSPPAKLQVDPEGNPLRKRQAHHKSRKGCSTCKRRKVKCDETSPACLNCTKRKLQCSFRAPLEPTKGLSRRRVQTATNSSLDIVLFDITSRECSDIKIPCHPAIPTLGFGLQIQDNGNSVDLNRSSLEILNKHSRDHREVACAACFARAGMRIEESPNAVVDPVFSFLELAPKSTPTERELLLYFERFTSKTLALSTTVWGTYLLGKTLQHEFVRSAMFLVTRAHMHHHSPTHKRNPMNDLQYVSSALSGLRGALNSKMTVENFESIIACTILLVHYAWTCMEKDVNGDIDLAMNYNRTADHFHGLKDCMVIAQDVFRQSKWSLILLYSPRINLERYLMRSPSMADKLEVVFFHCLSCGLGSKVPVSVCDENISAIKRLIIPLSVICMSSPHVESTGLLSDVYRYLFTWPTSGRTSTKGFILKVGEGNLVSLTILLYYYAAILRVYTEDIWWMRDGATIMFNHLRAKLGGRCSRCTDIPLSFLALPKQQEGVFCEFKNSQP